MAQTSGFPEDEKTYDERRMLGLTTPDEDVEHGHGVSYIGRVPVALPLPASIQVPLSRFGEAAQHALDAQGAGQPSVLTLARPRIPANRAAATGGLPKVPNMHLDEYPPAMFREGGAKASVRAINPKDNTALGAYIGNKCRSLPDGSRVKFEVVP